MDIAQKEFTKNRIAVAYSDITKTMQEKWMFGNPYGIDFVDDESQKSLASCWYNEKMIKVSLKTLFDRSLEFTLIHEIAHAICEEFGLRRKHDLEFAIINYALANKIIYKNRKKYDATPTFFNSYDIHEDECYNDLYIKPSRFNKMITEIEFRTIEELVDIAVTKALEIRQKFKN